MFYQLAEEIYHSLPQTEVQLARYRRAVAEGEEYLYTDQSDVYEEPAVSLHNPATGKSYVVFTDQCTCKDWTNRGPVLGTGEIELCKHQIACHINAQFVLPVLPSAEVSAAPEYLPLAA